MEQIIESNNITQQVEQVKEVKHCEVCNEKEKQLLKCARCKIIYYCGVQCQKKHWPSHKLNCSKAKQTSNPEPAKKASEQTTKTKTDSDNPYHGLNQFGKLTHIGSGNFSQIFKATNKADGKVYAIKQVQKAKVSRVRKQADLFMQKHCLSKLKDCSYAIKLYKTFQDDLNLFIQMECPQNGQLWEQCKTFGLFSEEVFKYYAAHVVKSISEIHQKYEIVHRDLKPQNILLNKEHEIKLIDFGTAKDLSRPDIKGSGNGLKGKKPFEHYVGTPNYMAPECIHNKQSEKKCDIYSLSGIFYFMKTGAPPFTGGSQFIVFKKTLQTEMFLCNQLFSPALKDLILNMNKKSPTERFDIHQVMAHQYFKNVDFNNLSNYEEALSKVTPLQKYLYQKGKQIFEKYHAIALQSPIEQRKQAFDKDIQPVLSSINQQITFELTEGQKLYLQDRIRIMKVQGQVMMNYFDDNSVGFVQVYTKDFNSAQRLINQTKNSSKPSQSKDQSQQQVQISMKKQQVKTSCEISSQKQLKIE